MSDQETFTGRRGSEILATRATAHDDPSMIEFDLTDSSAGECACGQVDRRRNRSGDPLVALHYQLMCARGEGMGKVDAMVVADDSGVLVAGAGPWALCEELAAYAPLLAQGQWCEPGVGRYGPLSELGADVDVQPVETNGQTVLLCARGGYTRAMAMEQAAKGVARILTSR